MFKAALKIFLFVNIPGDGPHNRMKESLSTVPGYFRSSVGSDGLCFIAYK